MFTGIIQGVGKLLARRTVGGGVAFDLEAGFDLDEPMEGESIACSGACLTAYNITGRRFTADVSPETLSRTKLGKFTVGDSINMERALKLSDRLGGHLVSGHIDCMADVKRIEQVGDYTIFTFTLPEVHSKYIIEKGSVTIDGISLTVNSCAPGTFSVSIIPHTLKVTTLGQLKAGHGVNIEVDVIGKYIENLLLAGGRLAGNGQKEQAHITPGFLAEHGFL
ncbi:riboflavin synthase [Desulfosediminicola sp.]|uniref:riboflavin synthase n=1 Tax=Desulfosediminicola sp. TaxID=2886825 RepID=UPI003AF31305